MSRHVVWFRNDLRVRDNPSLANACAEALAATGNVTAIYIIDPRFCGATSFGFERIGPHRKRFLRESLADLDRRLQVSGGGLHVCTGETENVLAEIVTATNATCVWFQSEFASEEKALERRVQKRLSELGVHCERTAPPTLFHPGDLPFSIQELPGVFTKFRRSVENEVRVADEAPTPTELPVVIDPRIPSRPLGEASLFVDADPVEDSRSQFHFRGGETAAWDRVKHYFWEADRLRVYKQTRNGMLNADDSSKLSPWLACGCLSPRSVYHEVRRYEAERVVNDSTYWLIFELLWRDYFHFIMAKHGSRVFQVGGLREQVLPWSTDPNLFDVWRQGKTGFPLIDANMRELAATGFMSNRGRQNVASFLTKNLGLDWRLGAEWFESRLIDYDPASNYGNWNYTAGVGNDARGFRWFNTIKQARDYDPGGDYVRHWLPVLKDVPETNIHTPWKLHPAEQRRSGCIIGQDYPSPVVDLFLSAEENERRYHQAVGIQDSAPRVGGRTPGKQSRRTRSRRR